ncbi:transport and Golgi organization 2-like protein [Senna tora]|uniref:Transport and Golgi organization 2-like protein n=1 Tax=Senna tora TaxID=362788 RepID=A0A834WY01_9FABA|nr:transport and Golgi organization 2-like protein [Senna tora]
MCIAVFLWQAHPLYPFLLLHNRDEYYSRPTQPLAWWPDDKILGGRDRQAGGTWLASTRNGRVALITNFRERKELSNPKSRGELPIRFLESSMSAREFAEQILKEADQYNGFNLILVDICNRTMLYVTNRAKGDNPSVSEITPGIHVLTNASLDAAWPKGERLRHNFKELVDQYGESEYPIKEMVEKLMTNTIKDEESLLPGIHPPQREYPLSSIFVEVDFPWGRYGTRSSSALLVKSNGEVCFYEKYLDDVDVQWKEKTVTYQINGT